MSRQQKNPIEVLNGKRDIARETAVLESPVNGSDTVLTMAQEKLATASNADALDITLLLNEIRMGQASILQNINKQGQDADNLREEVRKLRAQMAKYDEDARKWEEDRAKFVEDSHREGERAIRKSGMTTAQLQAEAAKQAAEARTQAIAEAAVARVQFAEVIKRAPKVMVTSPGRLEMYSVNGQPSSRITNEVVQIKDHRWTLPIGVPYEVPDFVAARYYQMRQAAAETQERADALDVNRNNGAMSDFAEVQQRMQQINKKYGTTTDQNVHVG